MKSRIGLPLLVIALAIAATYGWLNRELVAASKIVTQEDAAQKVLRVVLDAERRYHERHNTYAWASELVKENLLEGFVLNDEQAILVDDVYRIDVLLPYRAASKGAIAITPFGKDVPSDELATTYVALVARPLRPSNSGYRTYYVDQHGTFFVHEGVVDEGALLANRLPPFAIQRDTANAIAMKRWVRVDAGSE